MKYSFLSNFSYTQRPFLTSVLSFEDLKIANTYSENLKLKSYHGFREDVLFLIRVHEKIRHFSLRENFLIKTIFFNIVKNIKFNFFNCRI